MYQETEVKFYILDLPTVEARILDLGGTPIHPRVLETNLRFDTPEDSLAQDYRVLRLRQDSRVRLTYKGPGKFEEGVRVREEIEFEVDDFDAAWALLKALGYHVSLVYEKYRTVYHLDDHEIVLDETPLGNFIEIEGRSGSTIAVTAISPDPSVLDFSADWKWMANFLVYGRQVFEKKEALGQNDYSEKIREMLEDHLQATGITTVVKLRSIVDEEFWNDFKQEGKTEEELATAAIRKTTELRKTTEAKLAEAYHQYAKFSDRLRELIQKMDDAQLSWSEKLKAAEEYARDLEAEANAHKGTGLSEGAYAVQKVLEALSDGEIGSTACAGLARVIEILYTDTATAPVGWKTKPEVRKQLRQQVRKTAHAASFPNLVELPNQVEDVARLAVHLWREPMHEFVCWD